MTGTTNPTGRPSAFERTKGWYREFGWGGTVATVWLTLVALSALFGQWMPFERKQNLRNIRATPSFGHPFGTDSRGIDMLGRVVDGTRSSVLVGILATAIGLSLGTFLGITAGYRRGQTDRWTLVGLDTLSAFPAFAAASIASLVWGQNMRTVVVLIGVLTVPIFARVSRAATLPLAERDFVLASRMYGAHHRRVIRRELLPNIAVPILSYGLVAMGVVIGIEGALSFFGAGLPDRYVTWGKLIAAGQERVDTAPHLSLIPTGVLVATVLALNTVSERWQRRWLFGGRPPKPVAARKDSGDTAYVPSTVPGARQSLHFANTHTWLDTPFGVVRAVDGVELEITPGKLTALVGESGSGKTMLARSAVRVVSAPVSPESPGRIHFGDTDLRRLDIPSLEAVRGRRVAMVFQDPMTSLDPVQRIGRQLTEPMRRHLGLDRAAARAEAVRLLGAVGIPDPERRMRSYPHELSGGMRQRVAIAIALSCDPDILIADEPTSALDVTVQAQLLDLLDRLRAERGLGVLLITHDLGIVAHHADEVAVMYAGRIVEQGSTSEVFRRPRHPYTELLLGAVPRTDRPGHQRLAAIPGTPPILLGRPPGCAFAPRCPRAEDRCRHDDPQLETDGASAVACWVATAPASAAAG